MSTTEHTSLIRRATAAATLTVTALALSACGANTLQERSKPTITLDQAKTQIDGYLADILAKLPVQPTSAPAAFFDQECDANDIGPHGRKQTGRGYDFGDVSSDIKAQAVTDYRTFLTGQGFQPVQDPPNSHLDWIKLKNPQNNFLAILDGTSDSSHDLTLKVSSPCVWPTGTPAT
ncbi:hypothetical protein [Streptomyces sp. CBMA123]|uniref:hypothetical protein n=1 Tax=Streptomyces sp. CBMA123 TaxID=1896313 RepID=UPI00166190BA|nr:hypothetical protein [Streptomyces sp. CBMA123]MBD0693842.1 hypothetical protein [Streptomyces sp. CBMA123]